MSKKMGLNLKITPETSEYSSAKYAAVITDMPQAIFSGRGKSWAEAVGDCLMSNREAIGLTFELHDGGDKPVLYSTIHGRPRTKDEIN